MQDREKNPLEIKNKIISLLKIGGPSLPIHIARETNISSLFAGAFLSELASEKAIKISNLKIGSSPLYFLAGQESMLENFSNYLPGKEKEAFLLLRKQKVLQDSKQQPSIRVALRSIKDFAFPFILNSPEGKELFWRFYSLNEGEAKEKIKPEIKVKITKPEITKIEKEKPLLVLKETGKKEKTKEKSDFVKNIVGLFTRNNIEILEEIESKKKDYQAIIRINSDIGKLNFLVVAKDKKTITENDLSIVIQKAQALKMPALFLSQGEANKKAQNYLKSYADLIKFKKLENNKL